MVLLAAMPAPYAAGAQEKATATAAKAHDKNAVPDGGMPRYFKAETPEQRMERLGTDEDPGINPDPEAIFYRFGKRYMIMRHDKRWVRPTEPGFVKAPNINSIEEIYQE
ncbi:MAG TPA: hypothetical protein VHK90_11350, partial [Thermoanaerobaculia bacterium]|nr:hypothetical protein [Thermoanaerobaculia bacterium]